MSYRFIWLNKMAHINGWRTPGSLPGSDLYSDDLCHATAVHALLEFNYSLDKVMEAVKQFVVGNGRTDFSAEDILQILQVESTRKSSLCTIDTSPKNETCGTHLEHTDLIEENRKLEENKRCKICLDKKVNIVFVPCGHICACSDCSPSLRKCAICREFIQHAFRINIS